jgi:hypothetical protein
MNKMNRVSLVIGMLAVLVGIFSSAVLAEQMNRESTVDSTVTQVAHWQAMNPDLSESTATQVAHWHAMNPDFSESTVIQVAHWQAMSEVLRVHELVAIIDRDVVADASVKR